MSLTGLVKMGNANLCSHTFSYAGFNQSSKYRAFHGFGQGKFANGGLILDSSKFKLLPQLPLKTMLGIKVVKINSKIIKSLH